MPTSFQGKVLVVTLVLTVLSLLLFGMGVYALWTHDLFPDNWLLSASPWWSFAGSSDSPRSLMLAALSGVFILLLFSLAANLFLRSQFSRSGSPELFYLLLFSAALSLEFVRLSLVFVHVRFFPPLLLLIITQTILFSRIFALLSLLAAGLFAIGMKYARHGTLLGGMLILAVVLANIYPIDTTRYDPAFLYRLGDMRGYGYLVIGLGLLILLAFFSAIKMRAKRRFLQISAAVLLVLLGKELLYWGLSPYPLVVGTVMLFSGTIVFSRQLGIVYLGI